MKLILGIGAVAVVAVAAVLGYMGYSMFRTPEEASGPIVAAPVVQAPAAATSKQAVFEIDSSASSAKFIIDEVLRGSPKTVVGETSEVAGQISADLKDIDAAKVGTIRVNARTLTTDADSRNRMLKNRILETDDHEFVTFTPTQLIGLPAAATVGEQFTFQMVGNLAIKGTERETTFEVVVTPSTENRLEGTAKTTISYADWGVSIPQVPAVTGVSDQLVLQLDFVATAS